MFLRNCFRDAFTSLNGRRQPALLLVLSMLIAGSLVLPVTARSSSAGVVVDPFCVPPVIVFNSTGATEYVADTNRLVVEATPVYMMADAVPVLIGGGPSLSLQILIDESGALIGGVDGDDLTVTGTVDVDIDGDLTPEHYEGILLTGEIRSYGFQDGLKTDLFDFFLATTGGTLADVYGPTINIQLSAENSTFNGAFDENFTGMAKANVCPGPVECGECDGKVTALTLRYNGLSSAWVKVVQKKDCLVAFDGLVLPGKEFSFNGADKNGTLGTEIKLYVDGALNTAIHTSCSQPIGPGLVRGDFEVIAGASREGGELCPLSDASQGDPVIGQEDDDDDDKRDRGKKKGKGKKNGKGKGKGK
ncbi:MAG: hypothetical protein HQ592_05280 [Planctomycetes bacterium]|nr:hypothetical protein [Planctomycetota bacterium]